jgi:hypothetical protein
MISSLPPEGDAGAAPEKARESEERTTRQPFAIALVEAVAHLEALDKALFELPPGGSGKPRCSSNPRLLFLGSRSLGRSTVSCSRC